jgi:hypothetical protein
LIVAEPILIDSGKSEAGWSFYSDAFLCDQKFYLGAVKKQVFIKGDALTQGSMGHVGLAHRYARHAAANYGIDYEGEWIEDPDYFLPPEEAVREWARRQELEGVEAACFVSIILEMLRQYRAKQPVIYDHVLAVEKQISMTLGYNKAGDFGLWIDENLAEPAPLNMPGLEEPHPSVPNLQHGKPIKITKRYDLAIRSAKDQREYVVDHKVTGGNVGQKRGEQYAMDGQFAVNRISGSQLYPNFGGVLLNLVQRRSPWQVSEQFVHPTPHRDALFPQHLWARAHHIAGLLAAEKAADAGEGSKPFWPMAQNELLCHHRYGKCGAWDICAMGEG